jgi:hypothetical protein
MQSAGGSKLHHTAPGSTLYCWQQRSALLSTGGKVDDGRRTARRIVRISFVCVGQLQQTGMPVCCTMLL